MADKEFEELCAKAEKFGINIQVIIREIDRHIEEKTTSIARGVIDQVPSLKPDIDEILRLVQERAPDLLPSIDAIVGELLKKMPDNAAVMAEDIRKKCVAEVSENMAKILNSIEQRYDAQIRNIVDKVLMEEKDEMVKGVRAELAQRQDKMLEDMKEQAGKGGGRGGIPWSDVLPVLSDMVKEKQDPLAGLDMLINLQDKYARLFPQQGGIDPSLQFRTSSASFLEGIKIGARAGNIPGKKSSSPLGGRLNSPGRSSRLHPAVESL